MLGNLIRRGGKVRFACAAAGVAIAAGVVVFMFSLTATNRAQAPALAMRAAAPWAAWCFDWPMGPRGPQEPKGVKDFSKADLTLPLIGATIDLRPGGRVLQGPPMRAVLALAPAESPYGCTKLAEGRWVDADASAFEMVCTRNTLVRFGRGNPPPLGSPIKFVGMRGTMTATVVGYLDDAKLPMGWPGVFVKNMCRWKTPFSSTAHEAAVRWRPMYMPSPS